RLPTWVPGRKRHRFSANAARLRRPMPASLAAMLPKDRTPDAVLDRFVDWVAQSGLSLYPHQEEAILELLAGKHVVLSTPTGSGKSLVAFALHFNAMARGETSFYTCPI